MQSKTIRRGSPKVQLGKSVMGVFGVFRLLMMPARKLTYPSCFNAFSRVDVRVDVKIPGGVNAYVIDLRGERCVWL